MMNLQKILGKKNYYKCLLMDDEMCQKLANEGGDKNVYKCAQNKEEKDFLISLGWRFDGIEKFGRKDVYRMNKLFKKINN